MSKINKSPLSCLSGGLAARLASLFCVADGHDDAPGEEGAVMIVIKRKVGARLASVCVCVWLMLTYFIPLPLDNI